MPPLLPVTLAFVAGIIACGLLPGWWWLAVPVAVALLSAIVRRSHWAVLFVAVIIGWADALLHRSPSTTAVDGVETSLSAIVEAVGESPTGQRLTLRVDSVGDRPCRPFKAIAYTSFTGDADLTDRLHLTATLKSVSDEPPVIPDEIDNNAIRRRAGISATCFVNSDQVAVVGPEPGFFHAMRRVSLTVRRWLLMSSLDDRTKEFLTATLLGDGSLIDPDMRGQLQATGLAHILALSGLHVGIIATVIAFGLFPLYLARFRRTLLVVTVLLLWAYAVMTGLNYSVTRAVIMASVLALSRLLQRRPSPLNSLCFAALVILLFTPTAVTSIGFQLSFAAVAAIIAFAGPLNPVDRSRHPFLYNCVSYFTVSLSAMLGTGLLASFYFHQYPVYFLVTNIAAVFLLPPLIVSGILVIMLYGVGLQCDILTWVTDGCYSLLARSVDVIGRAPGITVTKIYFPWWIMPLYFLLMLSLAVALRRRRAAWSAATASLAIAIVAIGWMSNGVRAAGDELIIVSDASSTSVLTCRAGTARLLTTAYPADREDTRATLESRLVDYLHRRDLDSLTLVPAARDFSGVITAGGCRVALLQSVPADTLSDIDYAVLTRSCRVRSLSALLAMVECDTVVLSADISKRRHDRYLDSLRLSVTPFVSLRERGALYRSKAP